MFDYHLHTKYSSDCHVDPFRLAISAEKMGLSDICITDHLDFDENYVKDFIFDINSYAIDIKKLNQLDLSINIKMGFEFGLKDEKTFIKAWDIVKNYEPDFIIGSVHRTDLGDPYDKEYFRNYFKGEIYQNYYDNLAQISCQSSGYNVLGHYDYIAKFAPYRNRTVLYEHHITQFDQVFKHLIDNGLGLEINTSIYHSKTEAMWGLDVLRRYVELGGYYVTIGSDAHDLNHVGWRIRDAIELAQSAGIKYIAKFDKMKPIYHSVL